MSYTETEIAAHARQEDGRTKKAKKSPQDQAFSLNFLFLHDQAMCFRPIICFASFVQVQFPFAYWIHAQEKI
jgi:hypothetical protein